MVNVSEKVNNAAIIHTFKEDQSTRAEKMSKFTSIQHSLQINKNTCRIPVESQVQTFQSL